MANIGQIVAEITANTTGLRRAQQDASRQFGQIQNEANNTAKITKMAFAVAASAAVMMFVKALASATDGANETKKAMMGLESTSKAFGQNFEDATKSVKELYSDGIMPLDKSIRGFKNLLSVGFNVDEAMQVSKAMKNIGAFNNVIGDLGQAYEDSTKGLKTNSMELIENIGLTQRISAVLKAANVDFSDGIDLTNNAAQRRAVYNAILAEGAKFEGDAAKLANDNASANAKLSAAWKEMSDNLGNRVAPAFSSMLGLATELTKAVSGMFAENRIDEANKYAEAVQKQKQQFDELSTTYTRLKENQNKSKEEIIVYQKTIAELKKQYPEYLDNIDMEKQGYNGVAEALVKINEQLNKKLLFSMKEKEIAVQQQRIIDADLKKYDATIKQNKALSQQQALINQLSKKSRSLQSGRYITNAEGNKEFVKFSAADAAKDKDIKYVNGEYLKEMLAAEDEYALSTERRRFQNMKEGFAKEIAGYDSEKADAINKMIAINKKYDTLAGYDPIKEEKEKKDKEAAAKKKAEEEAAAKKKAEEEAAAKEKTKAEWKPDTSKTLEQKKKELEYNLKADLAMAKEEEKYLIYLKYNQAVKVAEAEDKYAKAIKSAKTQEAAKEAMDTLIKSVGESEIELNVGIKNNTKDDIALNKEKTLEQKKEELEYRKKIDLANAEEEEKYIIELKYQTALKILDAEEKFNKAISGAKTQEAVKKAYDDLIKSVGELELELAVKIKIKKETDDKNPKDEDDPDKKAKKAQEELDTAINKTVSSFTALANELDNNFMKALANIAEASMSMSSNYSTFKTGQSQGGMLGGLGMLSGGIGMFTSAVSIFQGVGGLFSKSTYNFDEAVQKWLKGIGEKAPDVQIAQYEKILGLKGYLSEQGLSDKRYTQLTKEQANAIKQLGFNVKETTQVDSGYTGAIKTTYTLGTESSEMLGTLEKIVPQLAEQLGTSAKDFGSDIASALSDASTFAAFSENLEDNVFSSVKSGLISAFMASESMKNLLDPLQESITLAVADDYKISDTEMNDIKAQMTGIENIAKPFYDALEAVGLNLVDASDSLAKESDRLSSTINRNLRLAEKIQMTSTGSSQVVNIDFTGANLGGVSEASMVGIMNRATAQSNIAKNGVR